MGDGGRRNSYSFFKRTAGTPAANFVLVVNAKEEGIETTNHWSLQLDNNDRWLVACLFSYNNHCIFFFNLSVLVFLLFFVPKLLASIVPRLPIYD